MCLTFYLMLVVEIQLSLVLQLSLQLLVLLYGQVLEMLSLVQGLS